MNVVLKYTAVAITAAATAVFIDRKWAAGPGFKKRLDEAGTFVKEVLRGMFNQYNDLADMAEPFLDRDQHVKVLEHKMFYISSILEAFKTLTGIEADDDLAKPMHDTYDDLAAERKKLLGEDS